MLNIKLFNYLANKPLVHFKMNCLFDVQRLILSVLAIYFSVKFKVIKRDKTSTTINYSKLKFVNVPLHRTYPSAKRNTYKFSTMTTLIKEQNNIVVNVVIVVTIVVVGVGVSVNVL